jgi:CHAD domain-containing protein
MSNIVRFRVREGTDTARLLAGLEQRARLVRDPHRHVERVVYETFDWRFLAADSVLELRRSSDGSLLVWRSLTTGNVLGQVPVDAVPSFAWHLPHSPVVDRLVRVTDVRALMPLATLESDFDTMRLVDDDGKTLARLTLDRTVTRDRHELRAVLELVPVRGYAEEVSQLADLLAAQLVLVPEPDDVVLLALRAVGFAPGSYSSKLRLELAPDATAYQAWITVLRALFAMMQANETGLRDNVDSEFLHDFRVAVRRTRSVLADAKRVLVPDVRRWAREEFRWIGQITSPPRDADVFLLTMTEFESALPPERRDDLKPFAAFLEEQQRQAHADLATALDSDRYHELVNRWRQVLDAPVPREDVAPDAGRPAPEVAGRRIRRAYRRVARHGRAINANSHPEELHQLRKDAKRLRYLLECFGSLFPGELVNPVVRELKGLQDVLGAYQDSQVQAEAMERIGQAMMERAGVPAATLLAMGSIVEHLDNTGREARDHFAQRFGQFDRKAVRRKIDEIGRGAAAPREDRA